MELVNVSSQVLRRTTTLVLVIKWRSLIILPGLAVARLSTLAEGIVSCA
jgi:hypothetical protein